MNRRKLSDEEKAERHREAALRFYYKNRVLSSKTIERKEAYKRQAATGVKTCKTCGEELPADSENFYVIGEGRDNLSNDCRDCRSQTALENYYRRKFNER
jgi:hypothetical protein